MRILCIVFALAVTLLMCGNLQAQGTRERLADGCRT